MAMGMDIAWSRQQEAAGLRELLGQAHEENERLQARLDAAEQMLEETRSENGRMREQIAWLRGVQATVAENGRRAYARLEAYCESVVDPEGCDVHGEWPARCCLCHAEAPTVAELRHVAGTRIGESPCPYLLDMRAMGLPVLDDAEEVRA